MDSKEETNKDAIIATSLATMLESVLTRKILQGMEITTTTISKAMEIKGTTVITTKERGMLMLLKKEIFDLPRGQEMLGMMKVML